MERPTLGAGTGEESIQTDKREVRDVGIMNIIPEIPLNVDKVTRLELKGLTMQAWGK